MKKHLAAFGAILVLALTTLPTFAGCPCQCQTHQYQTPCCQTVKQQCCPKVKKCCPKKCPCAAAPIQTPCCPKPTCNTCGR